MAVDPAMGGVTHPKQPRGSKSVRDCQYVTMSNCRDDLVGQRVAIDTGVNRGKIGTVMGVKDKRTLIVLADDNSTPNGVRMTNVRLLLAKEAGPCTSPNGPEQRATVVEPELPVCATPSQDIVSGQRVEIVGRIHKGNLGRIVWVIDRGTDVVVIDGVGLVQKCNASLRRCAAEEILAGGNLLVVIRSHQETEDRARGVSSVPGTAASHRLGRHGPQFSVADEAVPESSQLVRITAGSHLEMTGLIVGTKGTTLVTVNIPRVGIVGKEKTSVRSLNENASNVDFSFTKATSRQ